MHGAYPALLLLLPLIPLRPFILLSFHPCAPQDLQVRCRAECLPSDLWACGSLTRLDLELKQQQGSSGSVAPPAGTSMPGLRELRLAKCRWAAGRSSFAALWVHVFLCCWARWRGARLPCYIAAFGVLQRLCFFLSEWRSLPR